MLKLIRYLSGYTRECVLAPLFKMLEAAFQLFVPLVMASVVDDGIAKGDTRHITLCVALLVGMGVIGWVCAALAQYYSAILGAGFGTALRNDLFAHVMGLSRADVDRLGTSTLVTRITNDSNQIQDGVNLFFRLVLRCPVAILGAMGAAFLVDGSEGLLFCVIAAVVFLFVWLIMRVTVVRYRGVQRQLDAVLRATSEQLEGARVIRAFVRDDHERATFDETATALRSEQVGVGDLAALMNPLTYAAVNLGLVAVLYVGGIHIDSGSMSQGGLVALVNYMSQMLIELLKLTTLVNTLSKAEACANRVNEVFATQPTMSDGEGCEVAASAGISFEGVTFCYPGSQTPLLSDISLSVEAGQTLGVIGATGSGKSTLAALAMRFYDPQEGTVRVGGTDVRKYRIRELHKVVSLVDQRPRLFAGTIASNLAWAGDADGGFDRCLDIAQATDVVAAKGGIDARIEQLGRNLSGGQRQRLSIARTLVRNPAVLILDDASSALDLATEAALRRGLASELPGVTKVVISQRVSAIRHADKICVLEEGRMVGLGTHEELMKTCELYREICSSQLDSKEAAHAGK